MSAADPHRQPRAGVDAVEARLRPAPHAEAGRELRQTGRVKVTPPSANRSRSLNADHAGLDIAVEREVASTIGR